MSILRFNIFALFEIAIRIAENASTFPFAVIVKTSSDLIENFINAISAFNYRCWLDAFHRMTNRNVLMGRENVKLKGKLFK